MIMLKSKGLLLIFMVVILMGCITKPSGILKNETTAPPGVPQAPRQVYLKAGQVEQFSYEGHNFTINYVSAYPLQTLIVGVDGSEKKIQKEITDSPRGIYWNEWDFDFAIKPVSWEIRDGRGIPIYEKTWNTTELYFEVSGGGK